MMYMVRKQLYLTEAQDEALKRKAEEEGVSEAEVVRRALDQALSGRGNPSWRPGRAEASADLKRSWAKGRSSLEGPFDRERLYDERPGRIRSEE